VCGNPDAGIFRSPELIADRMADVIEPPTAVEFDHQGTSVASYSVKRALRHALAWSELIGHRIQPIN